MLRAVAALGVGLGLAYSSAPAQTRFAWPDTAVDVARYTEVTECLAATGRVRALIEMARDRQASPDTQPLNFKESLEPRSVEEVTTAQRCAGRFAAATAPLSDFAPLFALYLQANRDADASAFLARRLAAVDPKRQDAGRAAVVDTVVGLYERARPARVALVDSMLSDSVRHTTDPIERMHLYANLMQLTSMLDTARARRAAQKVVTIADSLTQAGRDYNRGLNLEFVARQIVGKRALLDNLRRSTATYVGLLRALWSKATGGPASAMGIPMGERAPPITANFWFPRDSGRAPRPTRGRVALVVFLDPAVCKGAGWASDDKVKENRECWTQTSALRRLAERFPALQITVVVPTQGYFLYGPPVAPRQEAELLAPWMAAHGVPPGALAVTSTSFTHLEAPDDRRVNMPDTGNVAHYAFGMSWKVGNGSYFLIDPDGMIVDCSQSLYFDETKVGELIDVLIHRQN